jgi:hypothetical protein
MRANLRPGLLSASWARAGRFALRFPQVCALCALGFSHLTQGRARASEGEEEQVISSMRTPDASCAGSICAHMSCCVVTCCAHASWTMYRGCVEEMKACAPHICGVAYITRGAHVCGAYTCAPCICEAHICGAHAACGAYTACGAYPYISERCAKWQLYAPERPARPAPQK